MRCSDSDKFVSNLIEVNRRAGVNNDTIDIIESFAKLRLSRNLAVDFFGSAKPVSKSDRQLTTFLQKNDSLDDRVTRFITAYWQEMRASNLTCVINSEHLSHILNTPLDILYLIARNPARNYRTFTIKKATGGNRKIQSPAPQLKQIQRTILDTILQRVPLNGHAEGFRPSRSVVTNARRHLNKHVVIKLDIKDFFPTISQKRVFGMFLNLGYPRQVAKLLSALTTNQQHIPTGSPTSPVISNIICRKLDKRFVNLGDKTGFAYSRYADDMTFSGDKELVRMIPFFREIVHDEGFAMNEKKLRILRAGRRQEVTGLVVNQTLNISKSERKKLRAVLHNCIHGNLLAQKKRWAKEEKGLRNHYVYSINDFNRSLRSKIQYVRMVNQEAGDKLLSTYDSINWPI